MVKGMVLRRHEQRAVNDLRDALTASHDLRAVLKDVFPLLLSLVGADSCALVAPLTGNAGQLVWISHNVPSTFLGQGAYDKMLPHDFVLGAVRKRLRVVLRDDEMCTRRAFEGNMMYHHARDVGGPVEQVLAVMLHDGEHLLSGLSLYRGLRRPFSERARGLLQQLTPAIANVVRNCWYTAKTALKGALCDSLLDSEEGGIIFLRSPVREIERTARAAELLDVWFAGEPSVGGLPRVLVEELAQAQAARARGLVSAQRLMKEGKNVDLKVKFLPLRAPDGEPLWALVLCEVPRVPSSWEALLTPREYYIVPWLLRGWDEDLVASEVGCQSGTVKKHIQRIYVKLGVENRVTLLCRAIRDV